MVIAEITVDKVFEPDTDTEEPGSQVGKQFTLEALVNCWHLWPPKEATPDNFEKLDKTRFKLYDDDNELYYAGWLLNDDAGLAQHFVLDWGAGFAGTTRIEVYVPKNIIINWHWVQEIS